MKIKNITLFLASAVAFFAGTAQASETLIASATNLQSCYWSYLYGSGGPITDGLYCYSSVINKTNKVLERTTYGSWCQIANVSAGYTLGGQAPGQICSFFQAYKVDMLPPASISSSISGTSVSLSWPSSAQAQSYDIFRNGTFLVKTTGTSYLDSTIVKDTSYQYNVRACFGENCSALSTNSQTMIIYTTTPANVFQTPKKNGSILGVDLNPVSGTNYTSSVSMNTVLGQTAKQFCLEQSYPSYLYYNTADNYGNGHWFFVGGTWYSYGGLAFKQITSITCVQ